MTSRKTFLQSASLLAAGAMINPAALFARQKKYIGLQLYTIRDAMQANPAAALSKVAGIGYNSVEGATYTGTEKFYGMDARSFSALLKKNGLIMPSAHYRLGQDKTNGEDTKGTMLHGWEKAVQEAKTVGIQYMVCAYLSDTERSGGIDQYKYVAGQLNKAGETCKKAGIQLCYHNHDFEFQEIDGKLPYDILLNETDSKLVKMELDLYWVSKAGKDAIALFKKSPGRYPLFHMKDMAKDPPHSFTEVGSGVVNFKEILQQKKLAGMQYFFVEQDRCPGDPFDSIAKSMGYIKKNLASYI
jgi:sugar phosphate isomerase/epimerase